ncbi:hypothetical protein FGO68_gene13592 [Halteria grandinella]|uniref:Uncharacterized protein n=1 Tax=Halteria grandinella TaxID=5974 RepID=A0A8J8P5T7_HALGN|nr:hypothetical protein FGO68_gene13592 [Halteria grandinella]
MQDRFVNDPSQMIMPDADHISGLVDPSQQSSLSQSRLQRHDFMGSANTTSLPVNNVFSRQMKPTQTQYQNPDAPSRRM